VVSRYSQWIVPFCYKVRMWQTDGQTDGRTERITTLNTALAYLRRSVLTDISTASNRQEQAIASSCFSTYMYSVLKSLPGFWSECEGLKAPENVWWPGSARTRGKLAIGLFFQTHNSWIWGEKGRELWIRRAEQDEGRRGRRKREGTEKNFSYVKLKPGYATNNGRHNSVQRRSGRRHFCSSCSWH